MNADIECPENLSGARLQQRRVALGVSVRSLAQLAGLDRATVTKIEAGAPSVRAATTGAIEAALTRLEGVDVHDGPPANSATSQLVRIRLIGAHGVNVELEGPASALPELEASAARLVRGLTDLECVSAAGG